MGTILLGLITGIAALGIGIWGIYKEWEGKYLFVILLGLGIINLLLTALFIIKVEGF